MATVYVSQSTQNGYVVGSDVNDGAAKATPKLTVEGAIAAASTGDTIKINSGVYTHASYFDTGAKALTFSPEVDDTVELRATTATAGAAVLVMQTPAAGAAAIGKIKINARGLQDYCVNVPVDALAISSVTITGTVFKDPLIRAIQDGKPNHTVTVTDAVLDALSLTEPTKIWRLYQASSHLNGVLAITGSILSSETVGRSVSAADVVFGALTTKKTDYL